jgi:NAD(P)-dependent dehydrogenase (short-subunit alcohol dehydrogenase family)
MANVCYYRLSTRVNTICPGLFVSEMTGAKESSNFEDMEPTARKAALRAPLGE